MRKFLISVIVVPLWYIGAASASAATDLVDDPPDSGKVVSVKEATYTYYDDDLGEMVTATGIETITEMSVAPSGDQFSASAAASCSETKWASNPHTARSGSAPYTNYVVASGYRSLSSGCRYSDRGYMELKRCKWVGCTYHPTVDSDSATARPGQGQAWVSVSYTCPSSRTQFYANSDLYQFGTNSPKISLCP